MESFVRIFEKIIFSNRILIILFFTLATIAMAWSVSGIRIDTGFKKNIPLEHDYMKTFLKHQNQFGGANRVQIAVQDTSGDIFNPKFFEVLRQVNDELFFLDGVDRSSVTSLFTPNTTFVEVVEDGFRGGPVIPSDFVPTKESLDTVWQNTLKAGVVGRLVSNDFSCAMVFAQLQEINPKTGERLNYIRFAHNLEERIRKKFENGNIKIHIIGFAKMIGDVADGGKGVVVFFIFAVVVTSFLVYLYSLSIKLTVLPIFCSLIAVVWQLGLLNALGYGLDPMAVLVPFLVFAIGVSHGLQMINLMSNNVSEGMSPIDAAKDTFTTLLIPGAVALLTDTVGFLTLLLINVDIIRELGINASMGVAVIILTNLILLPVLMSYVHLTQGFLKRKETILRFQSKIWRGFSYIARPRTSIVIISLFLILFLFGLIFAFNMQIGDLHEGAPALHEYSRYNRDTALITERFSIGVDVFTVIVESISDGCIQHDIMNAIDRFHWRMSNVSGVQSVLSLPKIAKIYNAAYNEGNPKWRILPRKPSMLGQATARLPTSTGLLNADCSVIPVYIFTKDHKATTIQNVVNAVKEYSKENENDRYLFKLASGPLGVMAAKNEEVEKAQIPMLFWVYAVIISLCLITFRSIKATCCVIFPLIIVSALAQALMTLLDIGLTVYTIPVIAMGVGEGVDYGIYLITPMSKFLNSGMKPQEAYKKTLDIMGAAVIVTGLTLATGCSTWIYSALKFQMDIGRLLTFVFLLNMIGAIVLLPALAAQLWHNQKGQA